MDIDVSEDYTVTTFRAQILRSRWRYGLLKRLHPPPTTLLLRSMRLQCEFFSSSALGDQLWYCGHFSVTARSCPDPSPICVQNEWRYTSITQQFFMVLCLGTRTTLPFLIYPDVSVGSSLSALSSCSSGNRMRTNGRNVVQEGLNLDTKQKSEPQLLVCS